MLILLMGQSEEYREIVINLAAFRELPRILTLSEHGESIAKPR